MRFSGLINLLQRWQTQKILVYQRVLNKSSIFWGGAWCSDSQLKLKRWGPALLCSWANPCNHLQHDNSWIHAVSAWWKQMPHKNKKKPFLLVASMRTQHVLDIDKACRAIFMRDHSCDRRLNHSLHRRETNLKREGWDPPLFLLQDHPSENSPGKTPQWYQ